MCFPNGYFIDDVSSEYLSGSMDEKLSLLWSPTLISLSNQIKMVMESKPPHFTEYQRKMWYCLTYLTVCRFYVEKDSSGKYVIRNSSRLRIIFYYSLWVNSFIKIFYLVLTYRGLTKEVHFLDQMSMWDWFLCFSQLVQEVNMWYRKYPLYEVLHANWTVQEEIWKKLGSPKHLDEKINGNDKILVYMHTTIVTVGCSALMIQFFADPKYALNTYAIVPYDNLPLRIIFAAHEYLYMFHIWVHQATSIVLSQVFAVSYTHIVTEMTKVMYQLIELGEIESSGIKMKNVKEEIPKNKINSEGGAIISAGELEESEGDKSNTEVNWKSNKRFMNPRTVVPGTEYNIDTLLRDYKNVMIASDSWNKWVGKLMAGTNGSNYGQFVSDVFMMIQLLKEPGVDFLGVFFYFEDACAGMVMLFRMLILMSRLYPASEDFLQAFKCYLTHESPNKKYLLKYQMTLKIVAAKIGGYKTRPITVPKGVNALMNYYIAAAMWQRPKDRIT